MVYSRTMASELKENLHEQWIEIVKYVLIYVTPIIAAIWKVTDAWSSIQKKKLSESLKDAVKEVVNPQLSEISHKMDQIKAQQDKDREDVNKKFFELMKGSK